MVSPEEEDDEDDILSLSSDEDLPGMWEFSDFIGGEGAQWNEKYQRWI